MGIQTCSTSRTKGKVQKPCSFYSRFCKGGGNSSDEDVAKAVKRQMLRFFSKIWLTGRNSVTIDLISWESCSMNTAKIVEIKLGVFFLGDQTPFHVATPTLVGWRKWIIYGPASDPKSIEI